jgi:hypothetical protein
LRCKQNPAHSVATVRGRRKRRGSEKGKREEEQKRDYALLVTMVFVDVVGNVL